MVEKNASKEQGNLFKKGKCMKNYLSFGGGVNSVALYLYLLDQKVEFEAVFVDHGTDWPETYDYVEMFKKKYPLQF